MEVNEEQKCVLIDKPVGMSPLGCIEMFRKEKIESGEKKWQEMKMSYAGRLDPMACGLLLVLYGEEVKKQTDWQRKNKIYEFYIVFGFETDSYDVLGMLKKVILVDNPHNLLEKLKGMLQNVKGKKIQKYPPFSSARVNGKPLFWWTLRNRLHEIEIPCIEVNIEEIQSKDSKLFTSSHVLQIIEKRIGSLEEKSKGKFREKEIVEKWKQELEILGNEYLIPIVKMEATVSQGTYIRSICHELGSLLGVGAIALDIKRTKVDKFELCKAYKLKGFQYQLTEF